MSALRAVCRLRGLGSVVVAVLLGATASSCGPPTPEQIGGRADLVSEGELTACVTPTPRLVVRADEGGDRFEGYDVEALSAVGRRLGLDVTHVEVGFDDLVSGVAVNDGRCDIGTAGIVPSGGLEQLVDVTTPYLAVGRLVVAPAATDAGDAGDASRLQVGVEEDGPAVDALGSLEAGGIVEAPSLTDLVRLLMIGDVDAVLVPAADVATVVEVVGDVGIVERVPTGDDAVMVLPRGTDEAFAEVVDDALTGFVGGAEGREATERWLDG